MEVSLPNAFRAALLLFAAALSGFPHGPSPASAAGAARPALVPVSTYAEEPVLSRPSLSPDGRSIAAHLTIDGKAEIVVFPADDPSGARKRIGLGKLGVAELRWAGSNRLLLTTRTTSTIYGLQVPVQRLVAVDLDAGGRARVLDRKSDGLLAGDVLHVAPDGGSVLVASQNDLLSTPSVKRIDLSTDEVATVEKSRPDVWSWHADGKGVVRAGIAYKGERWTVWYREQEGAPLKPIRGRIDKQEGAVDGLRFMTGVDTGLIVTNARTGRFAAYRYDFKAGAVGDPIYENAEVDIQGVVADQAGGGVLGVAYTDDRYRVHWIDPAMKAMQARIDKALPDRENIVMGNSRDLNRMLV